MDQEQKQISQDKQTIKKAMALLEKVLEHGYLEGWVLDEVEDALNLLEDTIR